MYSFFSLGLTYRTNNFVFFIFNNNFLVYDVLLGCIIMCVWCFDFFIINSNLFFLSKKYEIFYKCVFV